MSEGIDLVKQIAFWVFVTLAAGFIGYVGRYWAERLLRVRRQAQSEQLDKERAKVDKKRAKAATKAEKKRNS